MLPKTKYRSQIEQERASELSRKVTKITNVRFFRKNDKLDVFINGLRPNDYFERTVKPYFLITESRGDFMPDVVFMIRDKKNGRFDSVRTNEYIYNGANRRLDLYVN